MILALLLLADAAQEPWQKYQEPTPERLGPEPHTLVISDGSAMTRVDYKNESACQKARDIVRKQLDPQGTVIPQARVKAFCVSR